MAKHIIRTLVIILTAGLISGGIYAFSQTEAAAAMVPQRGDHGPPPGIQGGDNDNAAWDEESEYSRHQESDDDGEQARDRGEWNEGAGAGEGFAARERAHHHHDDSLSATGLLAGLTKDMVLIGLVVLIVAAIQRGVLFFRLRRKKQYTPSE
jgi:hypothetical protein